MSAQCLHNFKFTLVNKSHLQHCGNCPLRRMPFSKFVHMHIHSLVLRPKTTAIGLRVRIVHTWNCELIRLYIQLLTYSYTKKILTALLGWLGSVSPFLC